MSFELRLFGFSIVKSDDLDHARAVSDARRRAYNNLSVILEERTRDVIEVSKRLDSMVEVNNLAVQTIESQVEEILDQRAHIDVLENVLEDANALVDEAFETLALAATVVEEQSTRLAQAEAALEASQRQALRY